MDAANPRLLCPVVFAGGELRAAESTVCSSPKATCALFPLPKSM